jgi:hypothetical protein
VDLGGILDELEVVEVRARERGEGRTWPALGGLVQRLRAQADAAADLADMGPFLEREDDS